ncbi:hypothetical protein JHL18_08625 [Clostridium sp. YIM B02505]|uniref:DUF3298 domain-containing protein n=1 Tax=Clostridium yunnanense TaxID=2800325 RepID=A0ABS1EMY7_9CLOT|nr:hypothetical protein [Clostridium yunnanense]MBK1810700.1 hypothetical protein [Clostridium yunnanense]
MNKDDIKNAIEKLVPDEEMEQKVFDRISKGQKNVFSMKRIAVIAASVIVVVSIGIVAKNLADIKVITTPNTSTTGEGIYIPKMELKKNASKNAKMVALIVYQGKIYTHSSTKITPENAEKLIDKKIGTTKESLDEWSSQKDYAVELASTIGIADVYTVKNYDKNFRIMTYGKQEGTIYAEFYECFEGITVKNGEDVFGKLKIENNISSAKLQRLESWNNNKQEYKELKNLDTLNSFVKELKNTTPYSQESLTDLFTKEGEEDQKFIYITLKDGSEVELRLFKDGYIFYESPHIFFKMEDKAFQKLWNELD